MDYMYSVNPLSMGLFILFKFIAAVGFVTGFVFLLTWAVRTFPTPMLKKWGVIFVVGAIALCALSTMAMPFGGFHGGLRWKTMPSDRMMQRDMMDDRMDWRGSVIDGVMMDEGASEASESSSVAQ